MLVVERDKIELDPCRKFDIQLGATLVRERHLARVFQLEDISRIEHKAETFLWQETGNICIEYNRAGKPSGILIAPCSGYWAHELLATTQGPLQRDGTPPAGYHLGYFMFPWSRLIELFWAAYKSGRRRTQCGDGALTCVVLIPIHWLLRISE